MKQLITTREAIIVALLVSATLCLFSRPAMAKELRWRKPVETRAVDEVSQPATPAKADRSTADTIKLTSDITPAEPRLLVAPADAEQVPCAESSLGCRDALAPASSRAARQVAMRPGDLPATGHTAIGALYTSNGPQLGLWPGASAGFSSEVELSKSTFEGDLSLGEVRKDARQPIYLDNSVNQRLDFRAR